MLKLQIILRMMVVLMLCYLYSHFRFVGFTQVFGSSNDKQFMLSPLQLNRSIRIILSNIFTNKSTTYSENTFQNNE